jgi:hypothetical protein
MTAPSSALAVPSAGRSRTLVEFDRDPQEIFLRNQGAARLTALLRFLRPCCGWKAEASASRSTAGDTRWQASSRSAPDLDQPSDTALFEASPG